RSWMEQSGRGNREELYMRVIKRQIEALGKQDEVLGAGVSLSGISVILSGMASSTIGLMDVPYKRLPFALDGSDLNIRALNEHSENPVIIISGACSESDVMRGEETKVLGCVSYLNPSSQS